MKFIYILLGIGILIAGFFLGRALIVIVKGVIRVIKNFIKLGRKEFMKRLKGGFERITPAQRSKGELIGIIISLVGIVLGLVVIPIVRINGVWYWVELILVGSLILTGLQLLGKCQLYKVQKKQDEIMKELEGRTLDDKAKGASKVIEKGLEIIMRKKGARKK